VIRRGLRCALIVFGLAVAATATHASVASETLSLGQTISARHDTGSPHAPVLELDETDDDSLDGPALVENGWDALAPLASPARRAGSDVPLFGAERLSLHAARGPPPAV
jgi:hypothetical protein